MSREREKKPYTRITSLLKVMPISTFVYLLVDHTQSTVTISVFLSFNIQNKHKPSHAKARFVRIYSSVFRLSHIWSRISR